MKELFQDVVNKIHGEYNNTYIANFANVEVLRIRAGAVGVGRRPGTRGSPRRGNGVGCSHRTACKNEKEKTNKKLEKQFQNNNKNNNNKNNDILHS